MNLELVKTPIKCVREDETVVLPKYATIGSSGMDLRAWKYSTPLNLSLSLDFGSQGIILHPNERILIKTGLHIELPEDMEAQIRPRSGLALKNGITVLNTPGTVDEDYRGDIGVILMNLSNTPFHIKKGDRIAQMVFMNVEKRDLEIVDILNETVRGQGGFNSTGTK